MKTVDPVALFRWSVLGPLVSRDRLEHGELQRIIRELALREYAIPGSRRCLIGEKTIEAWYYAFRRDGIDGLVPKVRNDRGVSKLPLAVQEAVLAAQRENPKRSIRPLQHLLERAGMVARGTLSRSAIHRLLQQHGLLRVAAPVPEEHRRYGAEQANAIWYGDVLHGPTVTVNGRRRKVYLVSLMDDASRLIAHSAFCLGETALDIEGVLKQAVLKRGLPRKLVMDNGAAYRASTLQGICARLIYCRPYAPEGKGKLERWHRTFRDHFLSELDVSRLDDLDDLNARAWAWIEQVYHRRPHGGLDGQTPLERYQQDLPKIRLLGHKAARLDDLFQHRVARKDRKDGTVSDQGRDFEVPLELAGKTVQLVVDPHAETVLGVENAAGQSLGRTTPLDPIANAYRRRRRPTPEETARSENAAISGRSSLNAVELAYRQYHGQPDKEGR
jgi:transposase InsO family protein